MWRTSLTTRPHRGRVSRGWYEGQHQSWPLHDILLRLCFCARINHPFIAPPTCIAHTVAILLQYYRATFHPLPTPRFHVMHHRILCIAISCKGQHQSEVVMCACRPRRARPLGLYKICVHFQAFVHESAIIYCPPPLALPPLLQYYCTTLAQYTPPPLPPLCMPYTIQYW